MDDRLSEEMPMLPEENSFPEHTMLPEHTAVFPDTTFFQESAVTAKEENISGGETPEEEQSASRAKEAKQEKKASHTSALRQLITSAVRGGAAALATATAVTALAIGTPPTSENHARLAGILKDAQRPAFEEVVGYDAEEFVNLWEGDPEAPHQYDEEHPVVVKAPDCTHGGESEIVCVDCGVKKTILTPMTGHSPSEAVEENPLAPSCTAPGSREDVVYCSVCRAELSRTKITIPASGHTAAAPVSENATPSACVVGGTYEEVIYCAVCHEELSRRKVELTAPGHTPAASVKENRVEATCTAEGSFEKVVYCLVCHEELSRETEIIPALGHVAGSPVKENEVPSTCTEEGSYDQVVYCLRCGEELSRETVVIPLAEHIAAQEIESNRHDPSCTEDGSADVVVLCDVCGQELSRSHVDFPATGHTAGREATENNVNASCETAGGYDRVIRCTDCGEVLSSTHVTVAALGHNYSARTIAPTCTAQGYTTHTCSRCGSSYRDNVVERLGHTYTLSYHWDDEEPTYCDRGCGTSALTISFVSANTIRYNIDQDFWDQAHAQGYYAFEWGDVIAYSDPDMSWEHQLGFYADGYGEATSPSGLLVMDFEPTPGQTVYYQFHLRVAPSGSSDYVCMIYTEGGEIQTYVP